MALIIVEALFNTSIYFGSMYLASACFLLLLVLPVILNIYFYKKFKEKISDVALSVIFLSLFFDYLFIAYRFDSIFSKIISSMSLF